MTTPPRTIRRRLLPALLAAAVALSVPFLSAQAAPQREPSPTAGPTVAAAPDSPTRREADGQGEGEVRQGQG